MRVHDAGAPLAEDALLSAVRLGREHTIEQDPNYPIRLLVDIAIKALSPAINDPTTAVQTIDQLEDLLRRLGASDLNSGYATDENGTHRLMFPTPTWEDYLTLALAARPYGVRSAFLHLSGSSKPKRASRHTADSPVAVGVPVCIEDCADPL